MTIGTSREHHHIGMGIGALIADPPQRMRTSRACTTPGCITVLSVYNPSESCWQHEPRHRYSLFPGGRVPEGAPGSDAD